MDSVDKEEKVDRPEETGRNSGTTDSPVPPQGDDDGLVEYVPDLGKDDSNQVDNRGIAVGGDDNDDNLSSYYTSSEDYVPQHVQKLYHTTKIARTSSGISEKENVPISSSSTETDKEEKLQESDKAWNPMKTDCDTAQNVISADIDQSAGAFFMGVKHQEKSLAETPCPFYKGEGKYCWKGMRCRMLHKVVEVSDLGKERVTSSYTLDNKPHLQHGMWIDVKVVHIVSPSEFYVIPRKTAECICRAAFPPAASKSTPPVNPMMNDGSMSNIPDTGTEEFGTGVEAFDKIKAKLNELLEPNMAWRQRQSAHYALTELVAVKRTENGVRTWLRGVVLEANLTNVADREIPYHKVQLIDAGEVLTLRADEMCSLPVYVSYYPALAYKCCLKGVVPVGNIWLRRASVALQRMTTGTNIKMNVTKSNKSDAVCKTLEVAPYLVDLFVPRLNVPQDLTIETSAPMVSAAEVLTGNALALDFNQFPRRPILNQFFDQKMLFSPINPNVNAEPTKMLAKDFQFLTATDKNEEDEKEKKKDADNYSLYSASVASTLPSSEQQ
ncbi:uncharacterized protein LOC110856942 [Folsomia candida]|uniref:C3H1-type domain-containing protein n=1 Tax=Folsomia candida TaxID=158441 RepID=A0A226DJU6_FOLCA|nr:uncharacterized protein LOC110856942 [Folsomia candida]XP_035713428.1 uncharacterized protein LOC110856942 [Folsomia candida]OXA45469.1 hypothetical protein Fcan01_19526 [Folsomia candida]